VESANTSEFAKRNANGRARETVWLCNAATDWRRVAGEASTTRRTGQRKEDGPTEMGGRERFKGAVSDESGTLRRVRN